MPGQSQHDEHRMERQTAKTTPRKGEARDLCHCKKLVSLKESWTDLSIQATWHIQYVAFRTRHQVQGTRGSHDTTVYHVMHTSTEMLAHVCCLLCWKMALHA